VSLRSAPFLVLAFTAALGSAACGAPSDGVPADSDQVEDALIGGKDGALAKFPSTVYLKGECTAAKIAPRRLLTAAHCVVDPATVSIRYKVGAKISVTREPAKGYAELVVAAINVHPAWLKACEASFCAASSITARLDAPDVALIDLATDLADVPVAAVDPVPLAAGDRVSVVGFGCTVGVLVPDVRDAATLKYALTRVVPAARAVHDGSAVLSGDLAQVAGIYSMTAGPGSARARAGLCPGDSGGPLYKSRDGNLVVVGVNSNYTLAPDAKDQVGLPMTNWHTRLDDASRHQVGTWLRSLPVAPPPPTAPAPIGPQPSLRGGSDCGGANCNRVSAPR
jgi:secreted trypsin-like serine protease